MSDIIWPRSFLEWLRLPKGKDGDEIVEFLEAHPQGFKLIYGGEEIRSAPIKGPDFVDTSVKTIHLVPIEGEI